MTRTSVVFACAILLGACGERSAETVVFNNLAASLPQKEATPAPPDAGNRQQPEESNLTVPIPIPFRGTWAESEDNCGAPAHPSRLEISDTTLRFYESIATVDRVEQLGPREINFRVTATGEGTTRGAEYHYSIDATGNTLTDQGGGGMVRRRCGV